MFGMYSATAADIIIVIMIIWTLLVNIMISPILEKESSADCKSNNYYI